MMRTLLASVFLITATPALAKSPTHCQRTIFNLFKESCHEDRLNYRARAQVSRPTKPDRPVKPGEPGKPDEPSKPDKPDRPGRPDKPDKPDKPDRGNASANNGKGGNYDRTGHSDNGKGNGKGRR